MSRQRKYPKVTGCWTYAHLTPNYQYIYFGYGTGQCSDRWFPSGYKTTSLQPFIEQYGWDNLIHIVIQDGLTEEQAIIIEGALIKQGKADGWCINKNESSGNRTTEWNEENPDYHKQYYQNHKEKMSNSMKLWRKEHKEHIQNLNKQYQKEHKEEISEYQKKHYKENREKIREKQNKQTSSIEGRIYQRVANFNRLHPDKVIETPLEAKQKYLETGYIPNYIKNNDLIS